MSVPSLPLDIIIEIISHLEEEDQEEEDVLRQVENGKRTSLVCRSWRKYGQGLRWRTLMISPSTVVSLHAHLETFPHLALHVRHLCQSGEEDYDNNAEENDGRWRSLPTLLSQTRQLKSFRLSAHLRSTTLSVLQTASQLPHLTSLNLKLYGIIGWTAEMQAAWTTGFSSVTDLKLVFPGITPEDFPSEPPRAANTVSLKPIARVSLLWFASPLTSSALARLFLSSLDPSILTHCMLGQGAGCAYTFEWLVNCGSLRELSIESSLGRIHTVFSQVLQHLPEMRQLDDFGIKARSPDGERPSPVPVLIPLSTILASLPPNVVMVNFEQFVFLEVKAVPWFNTHEIVAEPIAATLYQIGEETRPIILWKDSRGNWYREIDDGEVEEEPDEESEGHSSDNLDQS